MSQLVASDFQTYPTDPNQDDAIIAGPNALYTVSLDDILPTQMNEGYSEVGKKTAGFDLLAPSDLQSNLLTDIEPVVIGPDGSLYLLDGHHTFTALAESIYGASDPQVYVDIVANYYEVIAKTGNANFAKDLATIKKYVRLLAKPLVGLKSKAIDDRFVTAAMLIARYRALPPGATSARTEQVSAEESKLVLQALIDVDWSKRNPIPDLARLSPLGLFYRLGLTAKDGWTPPKDGRAYNDAAVVTGGTTTNGSPHTSESYGPASSNSVPCDRAFTATCRKPPSSADRNTPWNTPGETGAIRRRPQRV